MAKIDSKLGFLPKTQNEYFDDQEALYLAIDPQWNLDPSTPDGLKMAHDAEVFSTLDESAQAAYNSKDPNKAEDADLNAIGAITGSFRSLGTFSKAVVTLGGVNGTIIPVGSLVESVDPDDENEKIQWKTDETVTILASNIDVDVTATILGVKNAAPGEIKNIVTTVGGWQSVSNTLSAIAGIGKQTNSQFRLERALTVGRTGNNQVDSILGEIGAVSSARLFRVYQNKTKITDSNGLPGNSIAIIVEGGSDQDVAKAIYSKESTGVQQFQIGTPVEVNVQSEKHPWQFSDIKFGRPMDSNVVVQVIVKNDGTLPGTASDDIKNAILEYSQGGLTPAEFGFKVTGFDIAEDVHASQLYTPVNSIIGKYGSSFITSLTVNGSNFVSVPFDYISRWTLSNIQVNIQA